MNQINLLRQGLKPHLEWHGARLSFLAQRIRADRRKTTGFRTNARTESSAGLLPHRLLQRLERECVRKDYNVSSEILI